MQSYTRRSRSSSSLPIDPQRVTSILPNHDRHENSTTHAIGEAIACTNFPVHQTENTVAKSDVDKLNGMLQNFYTKTAYVIIQSRRPTKDTRMNKWFYLAMADMMSLKADLHFWHSKVNYPLSNKTPPSTLAIHIYLDTTHLSQDTIYEIMGEYMHQKRWYKTQNKKHIILESWFLLCKKSTHSSCSPFDLPSFYKQSIIFFRALYSLNRLLPGFSLAQRLQEKYAVRLCYRLGTNIQPYLDNELPLDQPLVTDVRRKPSALYEFSDLETPIGSLQLKVQYRVPFAMDDIYDTHGCDTNQKIATSSSRENISTYRYQDSQWLVTIPRSQSSPMLHQMHGSSMSIGRTKLEAPSYQQEKSIGSNSNFARHAPPLCISPFKSPSLSPIPTSSISTTATTTSNVTSITPTVEKSKSSIAQYSFSRKSGFSPSFDKCKNKASLSRQNSTEKSLGWTTNGITAMIRPNNDLENLMQLIKEKPSLKLFQESRTLDPMHSTTTVTGNNTHCDSTMWTPPALESSSFLNKSENDWTQRSKASLGYFYTLRCAHSDLSESLASTASTTPRNRSHHHHQSSSSIGTDSSSLYDTSLSSSSVYQSHRTPSTAAASPIITPPMISTDFHSINNNSSSQSLITDQASSSVAPQIHLITAKPSSQLSTMEPLMEQDDTATISEI